METEIITYQASGYKGKWQITIKNLDDAGKYEIVSIIEALNKDRKKGDDVKDV